MRPRRLSDVARAVGGTLLGDDVVVSSVEIDSRRVGPGALFVALRGTRADGASFVPDAYARGAAAVLVPEAVRPDGPAVAVASTNEALLALAADERDRLDATVVAVTGANGKTTTKDMAAAVAATRFRTHASPASFNNEIGAPVTLLGAPPGTEVLVAELGARHLGDVAYLCSIVRPHVAVVTNVGVAHMEVFGSWEKIVEAAAEPVEALDADGVAILNADDPVVAGYAARTRARVVRFGRAADADVRAIDVALDDGGVASWTLVLGDERVPIRLGVPGEHIVSDALAAAAVGGVLGVDPPRVADALGDAALSPWRMETFTTRSGVRVVNDAYNANPESTAAALRTARWIARDGRLIAVLGEMAELGPISEAAHDRIGELAARIGVDRLVAVGEAARPIALAAEREGIEPGHVAWYAGADDALDDVRAHARGGDVVLCKASRVVGLERVAEGLG
ncbi:MAG TPA: UDP-N-acetylmuramoyl-tripeptide--D-alanyl-D-alanine ligase [Actinomycetota bacterium]